MTFDDPERRLITLDALEGYAPGEEGLYERVLVPVEIAGETVLAWTYRMERAARRLSAGWTLACGITLAPLL